METGSLRVIFVSLGSQGFLHLAGPVFSRPVFFWAAASALRAKFQGKHTCSGLLQLEAGSADSSTGAGLRDEHFSSRIFSWEPCLHFTAITTKNGTFGFPRQAFQQQDFSHRSAAMSVERNTQVSTASVPAEGFFSWEPSDTCGFPRRAFQQQ